MLPWRIKSPQNRTDPVEVKGGPSLRIEEDLDRVSAQVDTAVIRREIMVDKIVVTVPGLPRGAVGLPAAAEVEVTIPVMGRIFTDGTLDRPGECPLC